MQGSNFKWFSDGIIKSSQKCNYLQEESSVIVQRLEGVYSNDVETVTVPYLLAFWSHLAAEMFRLEALGFTYRGQYGNGKLGF